MAAAEDQTESSAAVASPHPEYPEMIMAAIESINDANGSNKSTISKYIESNYTNLTETHSTLLSHFLNKMKLSGDLVFDKNNYMKPQPNAPPKRGRGRPPKAKTTPAAAPAAAPADVVVPPRPRGRPPKDAVPPPPAPPTPAMTSSRVSGRKRGRPAKSAKTVEAPAPVPAPAPAPAPDAAAQTAEGGVVKRGRGRPPKVKTTVLPVGA